MREIFRWAAAFVLPAALLTASCATNAGVTVPGSIQSTLVTAEPAAITPQFVIDPFCHVAQPFFALVDLTVSSATDLFLQRIQFDLVDRFGNRAVPTVSAIPIPGLRTSNPTFTSIPMPASSPIPIPGQVSFSGQQIASGQAQTGSFSVLFDCGVPAAGTLSITVESRNGQGAADVSRTSVRVGP